MASSPEPCTLASLPNDLILSIIHHLSPRDLLNLCSTTRAFQYDQEIRFYPRFWRNAVRNTFRVPNYPAITGDGRRWMKLYRKMRTQTKIYGWGNNDGQALGEQTSVMHQTSVRPLLAPGAGGVRPYTTRSILVPKATTEPVELSRRGTAAIADLQCGGWSTTTLDEHGFLYITGTLQDPVRYHPRGKTWTNIPRLLIFPPGFYPSNQTDADTYRYDPHTAISQFSSGRGHVLGLSDSGRIWSWYDLGRPAVHIKFLSIDLIESATESIVDQPGAVRKVVAGWNLSTAYIVGTGIVAWKPSAALDVDADQSAIDTLLVLSSAIVPGSGHSRAARRERTDMLANSTTSNAYGEVTNHVALVDFVLFVTHLGKVFASKIDLEEESRAPPRTVQIYPVSADPGPASPDASAIDVQGSHVHFAILKSNGEVLMGHKDSLDELWTRTFETARPRFRKIPCLQHSEVISMTFGDWHYHALHADGSISSYGHDPKSCGALGIGRFGDDTLFLRGLKTVPGTPDRDFLPQALTTGRRIVFEPDKRKWLQGLADDDSSEAIARKNMCAENEEVRAEVSEWVEQRLLAGGPVQIGPNSGVRAQSSDSGGDDDLQPYFALSVAAAGWHSGALVLVDESPGKQVRSPQPVPISNPAEQEGSSNTAEARGAVGLVTWAIDTLAAGAKSFLGLTASGPSHWAREGFPRLQLRSGEIMPGNGQVFGWMGPSTWKQVEWVEE